MIKQNHNCLLSVVTAPHKSGHGYIVGSVQNDVPTAQAASYLYGEVGSLLNSMNMDIVQERIFARGSGKETVLQARRAALQKKDETFAHELFSYIDCSPVFGSDFAGFILRVAPRETAQIIMHDGKPCGKKWHEGDIQHIILQSLNGTEPAESSPTRAMQVRNMFYKADSILKELGGNYRNIVRTWFYLSDILDWYDQFNAVRNEVYNEFGLMPSMENNVLTLPSSTGIGTSNAQMSAGTLDLYAIVGPKISKPRIEQLSNKGQKNAYEYGAAFSRGTIINTDSSKSMHLSGTAAINRRGLSLFHDSCREQIDFTFQKIRELLRPFRAGLRDICAATAFLKNRHDINKLKNYLTAHDLAELPCVYVIADICRPELLFELDGELLLH
jgi:enamine deaminase RidA (YjgF/YER057c/UK114 family)